MVALWIVGGALAGGLFALVVDRFGERTRRRTWAASLVIAAAIYVVFAFAGAAPVREWQLALLGLGAFSLLAWQGLRGTPSGRSSRYARGAEALALGWALHAAWDVALHTEATVWIPSWYRWACLGFDLVVAAAILRGEFFDG